MHQHRLNMQKTANKQFPARDFQLATLQHGCNVATLQGAQSDSDLQHATHSFSCVAALQSERGLVERVCRNLRVASQAGTDWSIRKFQHVRRGADRTRETPAHDHHPGNATP